VINYKEEYQLFLREVRGLTRGTSISYITYLNAITKNLQIDITRTVVLDRGSVKTILENLERTEIAKGYWSNCQAALHAYLDFINTRISYKAVYPDEVDICIEGAVTQVKVNRYERDPKARTACITYYKPVCMICGFDFRLKYGDLGKGFIHVHHVTPLSETGARYQVDPIKDLLPVCPNCHAMLHMTKPPLSVSTLKKLIHENIT